MAFTKVALNVSNDSELDAAFAARAPNSRPDKIVALAARYLVEVSEDSVILHRQRQRQRCGSIWGCADSEKRAGESGAGLARWIAARIMLIRRQLRCQRLS
jgi:hypothetical protein